MVTRLVVAVEKLLRFPHLGRAGREGSRELVVAGTHFVVVYRVKGEEIKIGSVVHGGATGQRIVGRGW